MDTNILKELHKATFGRQDEFILGMKNRNQSDNQPKYTNIVEHHSITFNQECNKRLYHDFCVPKNYGLANIKLHGNNWSRAVIEIGGMYITCLYSPLSGNSFFLTDNGYCLPAVEHHSIRLYFSKECVTKDVVLEYDIVEFPKNENERCEFMFKSIQHPGIESCEPNTSLKQRLPFHHPVNKLGIYTKSSIRDVKFCIDNEYGFSVALPFTKISDTHYILDFGEDTINFSRLDRPYIKLTTDEANEIYTYAETIQVMTIISGMYGLNFSK